MYCASLALLCLAAIAPATSLRHASEGPGQPMAECRVAMQNNGEVDYTVRMDIGGQVVNVIPDTGSFPMVVFSDSCDSCGKKAMLLHPGKLNHFKTGTHHAVQNYGSGTTYSADAYAPAQMHCESGDSAGPNYIRAGQQMFWMTVKANLPIAEESDFQGILGLGPPSSDERMASREAEEAKRQVAEMKSHGEDVDQYKPLIKNLDGVAKFTKTVKPWLQNKGMKAFSVCLRNEPGSPGTLVYNDRRSLQKPWLFAKMVADTDGPYWQTSFTAVKLGSAKDGIRTRGSTQAILDTGTSLIGAPSWFVEEVSSFVEARQHKLGCSDISKWPDLQFTLGGVELALPASSYLGRLTGDHYAEVDPRLYRRMPHLRQKGSDCTAMIFSTQYDGDGELDEEHVHVPANGTKGVLKEAADKSSPEWIFGLPFFRTYYTTFLLTEDSMNARRIYLTETNEHCEVKGKPGSSSGDVRKEMRVPSQQQLAGPMAIDPRKLRFPGAASKMGKRIQASQFFAKV